MILLIDNNEGLGLEDYTSWMDGEQLPQITRRLNAAATMRLGLVAADASFRVPVVGARIILQRGSGLRLFTGYLDVAPDRQYLGYGQAAAWRYVVHAADDSWLLDRNALPARTPFAWSSAGSALVTLTNDALPGGVDVSGVQDAGTVNQFVVRPQKPWTEHALELATMARAAYRVHDGKLLFQRVGEQGFTINEQDPGFVPAALTLRQLNRLRNDITIVGEAEPATYVRDYFLGTGATLGFYLSKMPYGNVAATVFQEDYTDTELSPTLWEVSDPNRKAGLSGGQLRVNGGPVTVSLVEQVELASAILMQHGKFTFSAASSGIVGGFYNGAAAPANCIAGFQIAAAGSNCSIQAIVNGSVTGAVLTTTPSHRYALATQLICNEAHRVQQTYASSDGEHGGDSIAAAVRIVLTVHDVNPADPGTLAAPATVLYDNVVYGTPGFATYALIDASSLFAAVSFTRLQHNVDAEVRSIVPGGQFRTRVAGALADGGECYITSSGVLAFYPPYPPQPNEEVVVAYRTSVRAMARVQDAGSIAGHAHGLDLGRRSGVRQLTLPPAPTSIDCESAATAALNDATEPAWEGEYLAASEVLPADEICPGDAVQVSAASRGASFAATVREVDVEVMSLRDERSQYRIKFANDAAQPLGFEDGSVALAAPVRTIYEKGTASSTLYIAALTGAQVTNVIATEITVDAGVAPPPGGGIEVRRSDGGWGASDSGNLAGRFTTQTFILPRLSRVQGYYLRQYDGSSPAKYSRWSALLHVDYPL